jgi:tRNA dimethylallyltransferase
LKTENLKLKISHKHKLVAVVGPTASGKSDLAVLLAQKFSGEIISADSRQVYTWMDIGTGKVPLSHEPPRGESAKSRTPTPSAFDEGVGVTYYRGVPHHLLDVASPKEQFTVTQYKKLADSAIADIHQRGNLPFLVGGTGLYIQAVVDDVVFPPVPPNDMLRSLLRSSSAEELFLQLQTKDPRRAATIDPRNKRRLIRALEIIEATGKAIPSLPKSYKLKAKSSTLILGINVPREQLNKRIESRFDAWLKEGFIGEVRALHDKHNVSWERLEELGLNYKWVARYLQNKCSEKEMRAQSIKEIQHYAKRQMTWFKRMDSTSSPQVDSTPTGVSPQGKRIHWLAATDSETLTAQAALLIRTFLKN